MQSEAGVGKHQESSSKSSSTRALARLCHRAKNDLQTIANLTGLAASFCNTPAEMADWLERRVVVLATVYSLVSEHGGLPALDRLTSEVLQRVKSEYQVDPYVELKLEPIVLSLRICSPLSLWLYEMVANAVRHGFSGCSHPRLVVESSYDQDYFKLRVRDNGRGLAPDFDPQLRGGLGLRLAGALAAVDFQGRQDLVPQNPGLEAKLVVPAQEFKRLNQDRWL